MLTYIKVWEIPYFALEKKKFELYLKENAEKQPIGLLLKLKKYIEICERNVKNRVKVY